ncbi:MAG: ribosomal protein S18-alanine N-acetyltransferase [Pyrinomonadaceae bacterium]
MIETAYTSESKFEIQPMREIHLSEVMILLRACHLSSWTKADFEGEISNPNALIFVAPGEKKILGFISARLIMPLVEILNIGVLPDLRRQGIGNALLQKVIQTTCKKGFTESWLEVRESNLEARNYYLGQNYTVVGRRRNYYLNPVEDALLMTLVFSDNNPKK